MEVEERFDTFLAVLVHESTQIIASGGASIPLLVLNEDGTRRTVLGCADELVNSLRIALHLEPGFSKFRVRELRNEAEVHAAVNDVRAH